MAEEEERPRLNFAGQIPAREFASVATLAKWIRGERAKWEWLNPEVPGMDLGSAATQTRDAFNYIEIRISQFPDSGRDLADLQDEIDDHYASSQILRVSEGVVGAAILDVRSALGDVPAAFAHAFATGRVNLGAAITAEQVAGVIALAMPGMADPAELATRLARERANLKSMQRAEILRLQDAQAALESRFSKMLSRGKHLSRRALRSRYDAWDFAQERWQGAADEAVSDLNAVKHTYEEQMRLLGPVRYWTNKARTHGTREKWALFWMVLFFIVGAVVLWAMFDGAADLIREETKKAIAAKAPVPTALLVVVTGGVAALSTMLFWVGRIVTKLYLSEHHLRNDAHERAVMTTTYLALTRNEKADTTDRQIILNALFRSTPDGIVKEDGAGDIGLQAFISKMLAKP